MYQRRHEPIRVNAEELRRNVFACAGVEVMTDPLKAFFLQRHANPHGAIGPARMIKMHAL